MEVMLTLKEKEEEDLAKFEAVSSAEGR